MRKQHVPRARLVQYGADDAFPGDLVIRRDATNPDHFVICPIDKAGTCLGPFSSATAATDAALERAGADGVAVWFEDTDLAAERLVGIDGLLTKPERL